MLLLSSSAMSQVSASASALQALPGSLSYTFAPTDAPADKTLVVTNTGAAAVTATISAVQVGQPTGANAALADAPAPAPTAEEVARIYSAQAQAAEFATDRVIICFKDGQTQLSNQPAAWAAGAVESPRELAMARFPGNGPRVYHGRRLMVSRLQAHSRAAVLAAINTLKQDPNVAYVQPDYVVHALEVPNDPDFNKQYHLNNIGQAGGTPGADIKATQGWNKQKSARKIVIGLIDTGLDYLHPDLAANVWTNPNEIPDNHIDDDGNGFIDDVHGWDFVNNDNDPMDDNMHGTHCAGIIAAAGNNGLGVSGVAWEAQIMGLKFLDASGSGFTSGAINAVNYAKAMGVKLLSNSWGGGPFDQALMDAIAGSGALFVAAAGNNATDADAVPQYPAGYDLPNILSVAATDTNDVLASFSNYGASTVDVAAPGTKIYSTTPRDPTFAMLSGNIPAMYAPLSGTSMATPIVSGIAALILQRNGSLAAADIRRILMNSVDVLPSLAGKCASGGRVNLDKAMTITPASWLTASLGTLTLAPGESKPVSVRANPAGLTAGTWLGQVVLSAPAMADANVPVAMNVNACVTIQGPTSVDFGTAWSGYPVKKFLHLSNGCNSPLTVSSIGTSNPAFSATSTLPITVAPFSSVDAAVQMQAAAAGSYNGTFTVVSNAQNNPGLAIPVSGRVAVPPHLTVTPGSLSSFAAAGSDAFVSLAIGNTGTSDLTASLTAVALDNGTWLTASPANVTVSAGTSTLINVHLDATALLGGTYTGEIRISHNDPSAASPLSIPVNFSVTGVRKLGVHPASLSFANPSTDRSLPFTNRTVNSTLSEFTALKGVDMDNDGDIDLVASNENAYGGKPTIVWLENRNNHGPWITHTVVVKQVPGRYFYEDVDAADVDKDGDMDIVAAVGIPFSAGFIVWFENTPAGFVEHIVSSNVKYAAHVKAFDLDKDGDIDIVSASSTDNKIAWYQNDGHQGFTEHIISTNAQNAIDVDAGDLDGDGDVDVVSASYNDGKIAWYANNGSGAFTENLVGTLEGAEHAVLVDLDKDGDLDILASGLTGGCAWYENNGHGVFTPHLLFAATSDIWYYSVRAIDMDGDGDKDIVLENRDGTSYFTSWYENDGHQNFGAPHVIVAKADRGLWPADYDGDGDIDIACGNNVDATQLPKEAVYISESNLAANSAYAQLVNSGTAPTTVSALTLSSNRFTTTAHLPLVVPPKDSVSVNMSYATSTGTKNGILALASNASDNPNLTVTLNGADPAGFPLPGRLQAEDYKAGGEGIGYHDLTTGNTGGVYRTDNVDIQATTDAGGGFDVGWIQAGEWLAYDVTVARSGLYTLTARLASAVAGAKTTTVTVDGATVATFNFTDASGWQSFKDVVVNNVALSAGYHVLRINMGSNDFNWNYLDVADKVNLVPVANAGPDKTTNVNNNVTLDGQATSDPDNYPQPLTYAWTQISGPAVSLANAATSQPNFTPTVAGTYAFRLSASDGAVTATDDVVITVNAAIAYISLPGRIQAEDYKAGGEGIGYHDLTAGNSGTAYRTDNVDIEATTDIGGGFNVGWVQTGEWLAYDVNVAKSGLYTLTARLASAVAGTKSATILIDGIAVAPITFTDASGWQSFKDVVVDNVSLTAGNHVLRINMGSNDCNWNYLDVAVKTTSISLPGRIQAEDYKADGEGVGYHDLTAGNTGGVYRTDNVDIEATTDAGGGYNVGWIQAGEWLAYDVNVATGGSYNLTARLASAVAGTKTAVVTVDGATVATFSFTDASGWQSYKDVTVSNVSLSAGNHVLRITMNTGDFNVNYLDVATATLPELVLNGNFGNALVNWQTSLSGGAAAAFTNDAGSAKIAITAVGTNPWDIQIFQQVALTAGKPYTLEFDMKSEATPKSFKVVVEHNADPWTKYHELQYTVTAAANAYQHYKITWTQPVADATVRLGFHFGVSNANDCWLDNVSLK